MLFVDAGNNKVILGGSAQDAGGTFSFNSGSAVIRHMHPAGTSKDNLLFAISGANNGFQTTIDGSNLITYKFHTGGNVEAVTFGTSESVFNEPGADRDFRVETTGNANMLFVDAGNDVVNIGHATNTVGTSSGTLMVGFAGNVANGIKLRDSRGESGTNNAVIFVRGDVEAGAITTTTAPATQYTSASDERLKESIADADDASSKIDAIKVRKFDWKSNGSHQDFGLIAQELQPIVPDAVAGDPDSEKMMSIDPAKLVPIMLKEIQSLRARVADLES